MLKRSIHFISMLALAGALVAATPVLAQEEMDTGVSASAPVSEEGTTAEHHEEKGGFPQLDVTTYASQVFWLVISFVLLYALMSLIALPKVGAVLDTRAAKKDGDLDAADNMQKEAERLQTNYETALATAQTRAADVLRDIEQDISGKNGEEHSRFGEHARQRIVTAEKAIAKAKDDALASLADISAEIAADMVNKISGAQITKADAKKTVTAVMQKEA